ncbi:transport and Golgi organization protein 1 isoform X5 [Anthonomus grandis grandis]|uniref:transport and Golgi organization protein 1 isoform X5 n=1 Tax=Anthonomus grandis grandis TaxID=2921223 RepID=UPI0021666282|nr:transport and Golgi organization protein 1 isoform X5 [Anthonomus grandis grandis]
MFSFKSVYFVIFTLISHVVYAEISDKRLCIDKNCSVPIAQGVTLIKYRSPEANVLSFSRNQDVIIYSYGAGNRPNLIGVEIGGKRGYVNKDHIRELDLFKKPTEILDTEIVKKPEVTIESLQDEIKVAPTQEAYEIVDGTKIPIHLVSSSTEVPLDKVEEKQSSSEETKPLNIDNTKFIEPTIQKSPEQKAQLGVSAEKIPEKEVIPDNENITEDEDEDDEEEQEDEISENDLETTQEENSIKQDIPQETINKTIQENVQKSEIPEKAIDGNTEKPLEAVENKQEESLNTNTADPLSSTSTEIPLLQNDLKENQQTGEPVANTDSTPKIPTNTQDLANDILTEQGNYPDLLITEKDAKIAEEPSLNTLPITTETPLEIDTYPAQDFDPVTPDPANLNLVEAKEEIKVENPVGGNFSMFSSNPENDNGLDSIEGNANAKEDLEKENLVDPTVPPEEQMFGSTPEVQKKPEKESSIEEVPNNVGILSVNASDAQAEEALPVEAIVVEVTTDPANLNLVEAKEEIKVENPVGGMFSSNPGNDNGLDSIEGNATAKDDLEKENLVDPTVPPEEQMFGSTPEVQKKPKKESSIEEVPNNVGILSVNASDAQAEEALPVEAIVASTEAPKEELVQPAEDIGEDDLSFEKPREVEINDRSSQENLGESSLAENHLENGQVDGVFSSILSFFGIGNNDQKSDNNLDHNGENFANILHMDPVETEASQSTPQTREYCDSKSEKCPQIAKQGFCDKESQDCPKEEVKQPEDPPGSIKSADFEEIFVAAFSSDLFLYLTTTALSVLILIFVWTLLDKCRREGPLIARINKLEQQLLATSKENEMLHDKATSMVEEKTQLVVETVPNEVVEELNTKITDLTQAKLALEEQIAALEKELDNSTEMGMELNKIISEMLNSTDGSEILRENIEQMQKKVLEQQDTINNLNDSISIKETEIYEIRLELDISNKKVGDLQGEVDKMVEKILKIEEEKEQQHGSLERELATCQEKCKQALTQEHNLKSEIIALKQSAAELQRTADTKVKEYKTLKETLSKIKSMNNDKDKIKSFLDITETRAQLEQMKSENLKYSEQLTLEKEANVTYSAQIETLTLEVKELREKYEQSDKQKVEINTKLEVLNNYFKEKEEQLLKQISKYESLWAAKEGEATSTTERLRYMQEELQNYKAQNESLKQEIMNQEVELKSQISMLEKKSHENWVANRQTERKLEEARQEAAQLRNRLTMRERAFAEGNNQMRIQSPLHQNGEIPLSPPPLDPTQSPPPLFNPRDHITKSPPIPGLPPPPFLPPPPLGAGHFIPPPPLDGMMPPPMGDLGMPPPPFMPGLHHHPGMFPGDHRPPPLGRMSSPPPVGGRYSPESTVYSEYDRYDRRSPSPPYDSEYGASPPPIRGYSPYNERIRDDRREYKRPQPRSNGRNSKGMHSSGSENDSLGKISKKPQRKV